MEKVTQTVDFIWILFYFLKITISKVFFIPKKNPDLYIADRQGFFYNQSDIRYIPLRVLWDVLKVAKIIYNFNKRAFVSLYVRGGIPLGNFTEKVSDLDFVLVSHNPSSCQSSSDFITKNARFLSKKCLKIDISIISYEDYKERTLQSETDLLLNFQSTFLFGKKLKTINKIRQNNPFLWSYFSSYLAQSSKKNKILNTIDKIENCLDLNIRKPTAQQITKTIVRGVFEKTNAYNHVYTKNLFLIERMFKTNFVFLAGNDKKQVENCLQLLTEFNSSLKHKKDFETFKNSIIFALNYF